MKLSAQQQEILKLYAKQAGLDYQMVCDWVEWGQVTMNEISQGILGTKIG